MKQKNTQKDIQKDIIETSLMDISEVFADISNALMFDGRPEISPDDLVPARERSFYHGSTGLRDQIRDTVKYWKSGNLTVAMIGLESQSAPSPYMPIRCFSYDAAAYRDQIASRKSIQRQNANRTGESKIPLPPLHSVFTLCLYFGLEHWSGPKNLKECLSIPPVLEPYVQDYSIHLFEIAFLTEKQVSHFRSDFRYVADFFIQLRRIKEGKQDVYIPPKEKIIHLPEFMELLRVFSRESHLENLNEFYKDQIEKEEVTMEKYFSYAVDLEVDRRLPQILKERLPREIEERLPQAIEERLPQAIEERLPQIQAETIVPILENIAKASHCSIEEVCRMADMDIEEYNTAKQFMLERARQK